LAFLIIAGLLCGGMAEAQKQKKKKGKAAAEESSDTAAGSLPDDRAIDLAISEMLGAWQIGDLERLHKHYAEDVVVVSGAWEPPVRGWENYAKAYQRQRERTQGVVVERTNTYIKVAGNVGWGSYQWDFRAMVDGTQGTWRGHTTLILEKQKERWMIVHNHTSLVLTPPETPQKPAGSP
jgi:ketosteroid isomerase-like protein